MKAALAHGFLGFRGDFLSDLLIVALAVIVPALLLALWAARTHRRRLHRSLMWSVLGVVVGYVAIYEANMMAQGGLAFLRERIRMPEGPYFGVVAAHVLVACAALVFAALAVRQGRRLYRAASPDANPETHARHRRLGYGAFGLLVLAVASGVAVYVLTFVYVAA